MNTRDRLLLRRARLEEVARLAMVLSNGAIDLARSRNLPPQLGLLGSLFNRLSDIEEILGEIRKDERND